MDVIQLFLIPIDQPGIGKHTKPHWKSMANLLLFLNTYLFYRMRVRECQLVRQQQHNSELLERAAFFQGEVQRLSDELKQAGKVKTPPKKRVRTYNIKCENCAESFKSKSYDRKYCDKCRDIGEQRRRGFNGGKDRLK